MKAWLDWQIYEIHWHHFVITPPMWDMSSTHLGSIVVVEASLDEIYQQQADAQLLREQDEHEQHLLVSVSFFSMSLTLAISYLMFEACLVTLLSIVQAVGVQMYNRTVLFDITVHHYPMPPQLLCLNNSLLVFRHLCYLYLALAAVEACTLGPRAVHTLH